MIDMVFLLLIFFIVCTMYMTQQKGVPVELPAGRGQLQQKAQVEVTLPRDGTIWYQDHPGGQGSQLWPGHGNHGGTETGGTGRIFPFRFHR